MKIATKINQIKPDIKATLKLGLPIITGQIAQMSMGFVDTIMAGNLSANDLAAVAIGTSFINPVFVFSIGLFMSLNPIIAQNMGSGKKGEIGRTVRHAGYLALTLAIVSITILLFSDHLLRLMKLEEEVAFLAYGYIKAMLWGFIPITFYLVMRFFNEGMSVSKPTMWFALLGLITNIVGNYVFMYGKLGFPEMGAIGTGYSSSMVAFVMFSGMFFYTSTRKAYKELEIFNRIKKPEWKYIKEIISIGIPNAISVFMEVSMFAVVALLMGTLGTTIVAGHQIAINIGAIIFMIPLGLSSAISVRVGTFVGFGSIKGIKTAGFSGIGLCIGISLITATILLTIPELLVSAYTHDKEVTQIAVSLLFMAAIFQFSDGIQVSSLGALRGLKDTKIPMIINFIAYWIVGIPTGYVVGILFHVGPVGLWTGLISGLTVSAILLSTRFSVLLKRYSKIN